MTGWAWVGDVLRDKGIAGSAVFIGGSIARGWANPGSDVDAYVLDAAADEMVSLEPGGGRPPVDVHAISTATLEALFGKVSWAAARGGTPAGAVTIDEWLFLERLTYPLPVDGAPRLAELQARLDNSAHRFLTVQEHLTDADGFADDCLGQLEAGDAASAVISAQQSFLRSLDALLSSGGCLCRNPKWRSRAMREACPTALSYRDYWSIQTMADLPVLGESGWARRTLATARRVMAEADLGG